jgi:DNA (cytosine-5)-methyltransferase 1
VIPDRMLTRSSQEAYGVAFGSRDALPAPLRILDLFSGIGGFSYAAERIVGGFETVQFVEREPFCQKILRKHWPTVPIHDDICTYDPEPFSADVVCGGFPCQDISTAGKRAGIKQGTRSGLFYELMRTVRLVRPRFVVLENVAAITSDGLGTVLGELAEAGFDAEWACIRASDVGACHRRDRWWCVAYAGGEGRRQVAGGASGDESEDERRAALHDHLAGSAGEKRHGAADIAPHPQGGRRGAGQGQGAGQAGHEGQGACHLPAGSDAANPYDPRPQGRQPAGLRQHPAQRLAWPGDPPGGKLNPDWRSYVSEPVLRRGDDGLSGRVDRLKALGNAVVPQVAAIPLLRVKELAER